MLKHTTLFAAIAALLCGTAQASLVAHYEQEGNANDSSGNGYNGTPLNSPAYVPGIIGQAVDADGRAKMQTNSGIPSSATESVSLWVHEDTQGEEVACFSGNGWKGGEDGWMLGHRRAPWEGSHNGHDLRFMVDDRRGEIWTHYDVPAEQWHHVVGTYDHGSRQMTLYFNGNQMGQATAGSGDPDNLELANKYLGAFNSGTGGAMDGQIDDVSLYSRVLGLTEVKSLNSLGRSTLNYNAGEFDQLLGVYQSGTPDTILKDSRTWSQTSNLTGGEGMVEELGGGIYALQLDPNGGGVTSRQSGGDVIPEPSTLLIWALGLLALALYARRRRK